MILPVLSTRLRVCTMTGPGQHHVHTALTHTRAHTHIHNIIRMEFRTRMYMYSDGQCGSCQTVVKTAIY